MESPALGEIYVFCPEETQRPSYSLWFESVNKVWTSFMKHWDLMRSCDLTVE